MPKQLLNLHSEVYFWTQLSQHSCRHSEFEHWRTWYTSTEHKLKCRLQALLRTCSSCTHATLTELGIGGTDLMTIECTPFIMGFELPRFTQKHISHHDCVPSRANVLPLLRWCCRVRMPELCSAHWIMLPSSINPSTIAHLSLLSPYTKQAWHS